MKDFTLLLNYVKQYNYQDIPNNRIPEPLQINYNNFIQFVNDMDNYYNKLKWLKYNLNQLWIFYLNPFNVGEIIEELELNSNYLNDKKWNFFYEQLKFSVALKGYDRNKIRKLVSFLNNLSIQVLEGIENTENGEGLNHEINNYLVDNTDILNIKEFPDISLLNGYEYNPNFYNKNFFIINDKLTNSICQDCYLFFVANDKVEIQSIIYYENDNCDVYNNEFEFIAITDENLYDLLWSYIHKILMNRELDYDINEVKTEYYNLIN